MNARWLLSGLCSGLWLPLLAALPLAAQTAGAGPAANRPAAPAPAPAATNAPPLSDKQFKVLTGLARERYGGRWTELTPAQLGVLRRRAEAYFELQRRGHLPGGLVASLRFTDTNATRVAAYEALDISAAQTGYLLAAHAYHYAVMRDPRTLADIRTLLGGVEQLLNSMEPPGLVARFAGRADDPAYRAYYATYGGADPARPGFGRLAFPGKATNGADLVWLGGPSRDQYAGLNFGLAMTYKLVTDRGIQGRCASNTFLILSRLEADGWRLDDGHGNATFVTPALKTALLRTAATMDARNWSRLYQTNAAQLLETPVPSIIRYGSYAPNVAAFANHVVLARLETEPGRKLQFLDRISQMWREGEQHLNPFFAVAHQGVFDPPPRSASALATIEAGLYLFPPPPRLALGVTNSASPETVPLAANGTAWSRYALPLSQQPVAPFQWMQSPFQLDGAGDPLLRHPGVDYTLAFWMARDASAIPSEDAPPVSTVRRRDTNGLTISNVLSRPLIAP